MILATADAPDIRFRSGSVYTLEELAALARRGLEGRTQSEAADYLNEHYPSDRGLYRKQQISNALNNPSANPGLVLLLVKAFTRYETDGTPLYRIRRSG